MEWEQQRQSHESPQAAQTQTCRLWGNSPSIVEPTAFKLNRSTKTIRLKTNRLKTHKRRQNHIQNAWRQQKRRLRLFSQLTRARPPSRSPSPP